jgi:hypothetical protein
MHGKHLDRRCVFQRDRQQIKVVANNLARQERMRRLAQLELANAFFFAISQQLATLTSLRFAAFTINALAAALSFGSAHTNHRNVCVSRSKFIPCTHGNLRAARRNPGPSNE